MCSSSCCSCSSCSSSSGGGGECTHNLRAPRLSEDSALCTERQQLMFGQGARVILTTAAPEVIVSSPLDDLCS